VPPGGDSIPEGTVTTEMAGALARFWAGGAGPSHSSISTAFALAEFEEPDSSRNKEDRVLFALRDAAHSVRERLVEELLGILRSRGQFDLEWISSTVESAQRSFERAGHTLSSDGFVDWGPRRTPRRRTVSGEGRGQSQPPDPIDRSQSRFAFQTWTY
jgi:hypothetical protein